MAVTLTISGIDSFSGPEKHTVQDGATIAVRRTHDGFLSIVINSAEPAPATKEAVTTDGPEQNSNGHTPDGRAFEKRKAASDQRASIQDILAAAVLSDLEHRQKPSIAAGEDPATTNQSVRDQLRQALTKGATVILVERDALHTGS